jgi:hypothetical protein
MSRRTRLARQLAVSHDTARTSSAAAANLIGCICDPEVRITRFLGIPVATVAHDSCCPLVGGKGH